MSLGEVVAGLGEKGLGRCTPRLHWDPEAAERGVSAGH